MFLKPAFSFHRKIGQQTVDIPMHNANQDLTPVRSQMCDRFLPVGSAIWESRFRLARLKKARPRLCGDGHNFSLTFPIGLAVKLLSRTAPVALTKEERP